MRWELNIIQLTEKPFQQQRTTTMHKVHSSPASKSTFGRIWRRRILQRQHHRSGTRLTDRQTDGQRDRQTDGRTST